MMSHIKLNRFLQPNEHAQGNLVQFQRSDWHCQIINFFRRVHFLLFSFFFLSTIFFLKKEKPSFFDVKPSFFLNWNSTATFFFYVHFLLFSFFMYISFFFSYIPFFFASLPLFFCVFPGLSLQWGLIVLLSTY